MRQDLTKTQIEQAKTSRKQIPAVMKEWELGSCNFDIGGGKWSHIATEYLAKHGTKNIAIDPYHNEPGDSCKKIFSTAKVEYNSITCLNVLNVIKDKKERKNLYDLINTILEQQNINFKKYPTVFFQIFEKGKSSVQRALPTSAYVKEIQAAFPKWEVQVHGNVVIV